MNHIRAEEQRDVQSALFHCQMLIGIGALCADGIEHRTKPARCCQLHCIHMTGGLRVYCGNRVRLIGVRLRCLLRWSRRCWSGLAGIVVLNQLPDLFFERHLAEQTIHAGFDLRIGELSAGWMHELFRRVRGRRRGFLRRHIRFPPSR